MIGIILAGGAGTRLYPATTPCVKQLLPVYDKPMIYYPLSTLLSLGISEILIISQSENISRISRMLGPAGDTQFGAKIQYAIQEEPKGIADAIRIASFIEANTRRDCCLILGDNIFHGCIEELMLAKSYVANTFDRKAAIPLYQTKEYNRYGMAIVNDPDPEFNVHHILEKPVVRPDNSYAVPGVYFYPTLVYEYIKKLKPSSRGELEITDLNNVFAMDNSLKGFKLRPSSVWLDAGTPSSLLMSSEYVRSYQERTGMPIGSPEYSAYEAGLISQDKFSQLVSEMPESYYKNLLRELT